MTRVDMCENEDLRSASQRAVFRLMSRRGMSEGVATPTEILHIPHLNYPSSQKIPTAARSFIYYRRLL